MATMDCRVERDWRGGTAVLRVAGSVDMVTAPYLESSLSACLAEKPVGLIIDLSDTDFLASAGLAVLIHGCAQAGELGIGFAVVADSPATSRPITLLGLDDALNLKPDMDEALAALDGGV